MIAPGNALRSSSVSDDGWKDLNQGNYAGQVDEVRRVRWDGWRRRHVR